jgi:hypothetical protein
MQSGVSLGIGRINFGRLTRQQNDQASNCRQAARCVQWRVTIFSSNIDGLRSLWTRKMVSEKRL